MRILPEFSEAPGSLGEAFIMGLPALEDAQSQLLQRPARKPILAPPPFFLARSSTEGTLGT